MSWKYLPVIKIKGTGRTVAKTYPQLKSSAFNDQASAEKCAQEFLDDGKVKAVALATASARPYPALLVLPEDLQRFGLRWNGSRSGQHPTRVADFDNEGGKLFSERKDKIILYWRDTSWADWIGQYDASNLLKLLVPGSTRISDSRLN